MNNELALPHAVIFTGVSGSGKDYLIDHSLIHLPQNLSVVNVGSMMSERLRLDRDTIRSMASIKDINGVVIEVAKEIRARQVRVINAHALSRNQGTYIFNGTFLEIISPRHIVNVISDPESIFLRRAHDTQRKRTEESVERIELHQALQSAALWLWCVPRRVGLTTIYNSEDKALTKQNIELVRSLFTY